MNEPRTVGWRIDQADLGEAFDRLQVAIAAENKPQIAAYLRTMQQIVERAQTDPAQRQAEVQARREREAERARAKRAALKAATGCTTGRPPKRVCLRCGGRHGYQSCPQGRES